MLRKTLVTFLFTAIFIQVALAENSDFMRSIGKMYVVVAVLVAIFIGIVIYLFTMDRKIKKIENFIKNER